VVGAARKELAMAKRKMHFVTLICAGPTNHHNGGWRHPAGDGHLVLDAGRYEEIARISERGLFDGVFLVDYQFQQGLEENAPNLVAQYGGQMVMLDPLQLLAAMARVTRHIGLTATLSTTFYHAYHIARAFATLDHISGGRAGWNIVTSGNPAEAANHGMDGLKERVSRYDLADEVIEACMALWNTWEADALRFDKTNGIFADPGKVHYVKYDGTMVRTHGGLTTPRPPQGHPVLMQAGSSPRGREFAARWAEVVFTVQNEKSLMQAFYADMKARVRQAGRIPEHCAIMPAIDVIVAETEEQALAQAEYVDSLASVALGLQTLRDLTGVDVSKLPMDTPFAEVPVDPERIVAVGVYQNVLAMRKDGRGLTLEETARLYATTWMSPRLVGTPAMIVDRMQDIFESAACDGFVIGTSTSPMGLQDFVDQVVPELQRRGLYRTEYQGATFRENLRSG
jgi:FMN-dependent oxidoreductase (nitrilotriacetate monooxygenase family)